MTLTRLTTLAAVLCLTLAPGSCGGGGSTPPPTGPTGEAEHRLTAPAGLTVTYFARGLSGVRAMTLGPDGAVYASLPGENRVVRVWDADGDGAADSTATAVSGLNRPYGLAFHGGWLYIANTDGVVRVHLDARGRAAGTPEELNAYSSGAGHWTRSILFARDGAMYVSIGSSCDLCVESAPDRAAVMRYDVDGKNGAVFARGLRNAVGMAVEPTTGAIWVSQNERDNLGDDVPPEEINILREHGEYGWPYCYSRNGAAVPTPDQSGATPERCAATIPAALEMQAHSAPLGMTFLDQATDLPAEYRSDLLVAFHGSWNRSTPTGAKVVRVHVAGGRPTGYEDFVTGWQLPDGSRWGRPVDVLVHRDGSVLISDDRNDAIYRVAR